MAVEIKELVIRAVLDYGETNRTGPGAPAATSLSETEKAEMIQACVRQVLKVLKQQQKR